MQYKSTRNSGLRLEASQVIAQGISQEGGLFVPEALPDIREKLPDLMEMDYHNLAKELFGLFLTDFSKDQIEKCVALAYSEEKFEGEPVRMVHLPSDKGDPYLLELWHGPTCAFKDMALQILPHFLTVSLEKSAPDKEAVILVATSGDTGKAALEGFRDVPGTRVVVFYPQDGVSPMQKRQMATQGLLFSSANSINWGRLLPQIVYYFYAYFQICRDGRISLGDLVNIAVPTGNFGNILAAYYAREMGLPVQRLICASNSNRVLTDFINTGIYDRRREFFTTLSPSMDILVSSNLERLLYAFSGEDSKTLSKWMEHMAPAGSDDVGETLCKKIKNLFYGGFCDDSATVGTIADTWRNHRYLCDTHTAVAVNVYRQYVRETSDSQTPTIIASTASPYKFVKDVLGALEPVNSGDEFLNIARLEELTGMAAPLQLRNLKDKPNRFHTVIPKARSAQYILETLGIGEE